MGLSPSSRLSGNPVLRDTPTRHDFSKTKYLHNSLFNPFQKQPPPICFRTVNAGLACVLPKCVRTNTAPRRREPHLRSDPPGTAVYSRPRRVKSEETNSVASAPATSPSLDE